MLNVAAGFARLAFRSASREFRAFRNSQVERRAAALATQLPPSRHRIPDSDGFLKFSAGEIGIAPAIESIGELAQRWKADPSRSESDKPFLRNVMQPDDLLQHRQILDVALNGDLLACISTYLGQLPRLVNLQVWWTPPNQTTVRSQLFHYDHRDMRQAKIFINLNDVDETAGPLHFLSARNCLKVDRTVGYSQGRYSDEQVFDCCSPEDVIRTVGPKGSGFIVDTARCLHYGSRQNVKDRLVLMASFARANCVSLGAGCEVLDPVRQMLIEGRYAQDPVRSFVLTDIRPAANA